MADALIDAVEKNDVALVRQLIGRGVYVDGVDNAWGRSALYWAAREGFVECAKVLLEANADVHKANDSGWNPLHPASYNGHVECVKVGCLFGLWMKKQSHFSLLQLLINWKANVNAKTNSDRSPLHFAAMGGHLACVEVR